ncbi:Uncharacterised protein [Klebsiella quasipneumoniae]|uniref:Ribbon-helix-helix protein CopG domain-containing protein n=1 Tax=Klebsiella quasipneumoniae TaxID=1463165 RepID=A0ABD7NC34_9ENTR|nr:Uncharacterised protein [Klebsiella quasipneumoniae]SSH02735.1 Uncharacterised protein [Klebsiella quasipneumoniae]
MLQISVRFSPEQVKAMRSGTCSGSQSKSLRLAISAYFGSH